MSLKLLISVLFSILLIKICLTRVESKESYGIDILPVNASLACSQETQPLVVRQNYGYINSLDFDGFHFYPPNINCSWLLIAEQNNSFFIRFNALELDYYRKDGLYLYDGYNSSAPLIERYSGSQRNLPNYRSPGRVLYLRFIGLEKPKTVGFMIYFEQRPVPVHCNKDQISCRNQIKCVDAKYSCDGVDDCQDGTDEEKCTNNNLDFTDGCGKPKITPQLNFLRIVGGKRAIPGSWPWMVSMRIPAHEPNGHTCGASVLNREWILTAAHCFNDYSKPNQWQIHLGKYEKLVRDKTEVIRYIENIYIHPDYKGDKELPSNASWYQRKANDLALIKLNAPLPINSSFISSVCLPDISEVLKPKETCFVTGWGSTQQTGDDLVLKQAEVPIVSNDVCREWMPYFDVNENTMICAGREEGGQDSCQGDSGGPLVRLNPKTKRYEIVGIVSTGGLCGGKKEAGIYTKVSHFVPWIKLTVLKYYKELKSIKSQIINTILDEWYDLMSDDKY